MFKLLKLILIFVFLAVVFAPEAQILAREGPEEGGTSYVPSKQRLDQTISSIPVRALNYLKKAMPFTPEQWKEWTRSVVLFIKDAISAINFKNFFNDTMRILGNIKEFFISVYHEFY